MAVEDEFAARAAADRAWPRLRRRRIAVVLSGVLLAVLVLVWAGRERIAGNIISGQLGALDLPATYEIESIGARRQILRNVVVGDPDRPALTIERVEAVIEPRWGVPGIGEIKLTRPRLYGVYSSGTLSFGSLDRVIFTGSKQAFRLPDLAVSITDGRGLISGDAGSVGLKVEGYGRLRGGFRGIVAATAPRAVLNGCEGTGLTLYGNLSIDAERPRFAGPVRLAGLRCRSGLNLARAGGRVDVRFDQALDGAEGTFGLHGERVEWLANMARDTSGSIRFSYRRNAVTARYTLAAREVETPYARAGSLALEGALRSVAGLTRFDTDGELRGEGLSVGDMPDLALARAQHAGSGTFAAPLLTRIRGALAREGRVSSLVSSFVLRKTAGSLNLVVPQATLRGRGSDALLSVSRFQLAQGANRPPRLAGNFFTGGEGLPRLAGRMERQDSGRLVMRLNMPAYSAGDASVALPRLVIVQLANGAIGFGGEARLSGPLPGGSARDLVLPLSGNWSARTGLSAWRNCTTVRFGQLMFANLAIESRAVSLCPPPGGAILRSDERGTRIAAGTRSLDLSGRLGTTPIRLRTGAIGAALPGVLTARSVEVALGPSATASRFTIASLDARIGKAGGDVSGRFSGSDVRLGAVPLDLLAATGEWRFGAGRLTLANASFRLEDRELDDRFRPLAARDASLVLAGNVITAEALLREPASERAVIRAAILHDLSSARGHADLFVDDLVFDQQVQPDTLTTLALGVIANAQGKVRGTGRIDWTATKVTSSGRFGTDSLDFAAAFGPVKGAAGMVEFTDLLGMVTAPDQQLRIASVNPGIEVNDGLLTYALQPNSVLAVAGARWPFFDGTLTLQPTRMTLGAQEERRFTLAIAGLNAARFVERLELANMTANGTFDGAMPLVFDQNGGRIEGGKLRSRAPGGNVSYVGALTYKDLSPIANFAFDALKSLNYRQMDIAMDGALEGELVTRLRFSGVSQGQGARRNFLTRRLASLPLQFNVNLRAPFFQLISSFKSFYDPEYVRDPRTLGLMDAQGRAIAAPPAAPATVPTGIQPGESETMR